MLSETLEKISIETCTGEQERSIINSFLQQGESLEFIRDVCLDTRIGLNPEIVESILDNHTSFQQDGNFIYVPSIGLYIAKKRTHLRKNWFECHKLLQANNERMMILPEFIEFLKYCKINHKDVYNEITKVRSSWRAEWIDADFKMKGKYLYINYNHVLDASGNLIPKNSELLDKDTLMKDKTPKISLDDYLGGNHTSQGLPNLKVKSGDLYHWYPRKDNNSVARFDASSIRANLSCEEDPLNQDSNLGVRAVRHA